MKTLSGTFKLVALAAIAVGSILTFRLIAIPTPTPSPTPAPQSYLLEILGNPLPVTNIVAFKTLLTGLPGMQKEGATLYNGLGGSEKWPPSLSMATSTPIKSPTATGEAMLTGVNVTQRVTSTSGKDFQEVLNSFKTPTPTPTP